MNLCMCVCLIISIDNLQSSNLPKSVPMDNLYKNSLRHHVAATALDIFLYIYIYTHIYFSLYFYTCIYVLVHALSGKSVRELQVKVSLSSEENGKMDAYFVRDRFYCCYCCCSRFDMVYLPIFTGIFLHFFSFHFLIFILFLFDCLYS